MTGVQTCALPICTASKYRSITFKDGEIRKKAKSKTTVTKALDGYRSMRVKEVKKKFFLRFYPNMEKLNLRKQIVEHPFGTIKRWCDGSYLLLKGRYKATADLSFSFLSYNLKRTINIIGTQKLLELLWYTGSFFAKTYWTHEIIDDQSSLFQVFGQSPFKVCELFSI